MKIAAITDDGETISRHFGRAAHYLVATIEDGKISGRQLRDKLGRSRFVARLHEARQSTQMRDVDATFYNKHLQLTDPIADCEALLCGGMEMGTYKSMQVYGICPIITDITEIDEAVRAYVKGEITNHVENLY